ncbi:MAG: thioredoxin domain-containing protein [Firmicutes bacterium HGW-Firmicutes-8]|nr:MAG: thioredoxin domain-containing protein [Firmicutes bacterium HGW-Firmicutes-8]
MKTTQIPNRLSKEKSPYLLQHANNPVDWYPWGDEAFGKAKKEDKPVFLSVGYSTCHWCHVMERESFEDNEVAELLNKHFVSIKVDREERPDIDTIYMAVCQAMTGHGGWPLTVVMTPDKKPFFAGTYFPKKSSRGLPGVIDLISQISSLWENEKERVLSSSREITQFIEDSLAAQVKGELDEDVLHRAYSYFKEAFDREYGGFGRAPKFPTPHNLTFLLRYWKMTGKPEALEMVEKTLDSMYLGGIYDHIGFGFARYATDRKWLVPHFEKMLYDNAQLAIAYLEAFQATGKAKYARAARDIFTYVLRDMTSPGGGFFSAEDADSEGEEGTFYIWTPREITAVLGEDEGNRFCKIYGITDRGNFEEKSIPNLIETGFIEGFDNAREKLFAARARREHPFKDDKILTAWNGLMIAALAFGYRVLGEPKYKKAAESAINFISTKLIRSDGRLLARYRDEEAAYPGYVEDYAFLIWGLIELYEATFTLDHLTTALKLNRDLLRYFWDEENGGLFQYGSDAETLLTRPKETYDGTLPSGNSVAALNFLRLARLTGNTGLPEKAQTQLRAFGGSINDAPAGHTFFLMAVYFNLVPTTEITIVGDPQSGDTKEMLRTVYSRFGPEILVTGKPMNEVTEKLVKVIPSIKGRQAVDGKATAYVCKDFACQEPVTDSEKLASLLWAGKPD